MTLWRKGWPWGFFWLAVAVAVVINLATYWPPVKCAAAKAEANQDIVATDYCYKILITITNSTGSTLINYPVRIQINSNGLIGGKQLSAFLWDLRPVTTALSPVEVTAQNINSSTARWWLRVPSVATGQTASFWFYMGNKNNNTSQTNPIGHNNFRDQGFILDGNDSLTVTNNALLDLTNRFALIVNVATPTRLQNAWFVTKWAANTGYRLGVVDVAGTPKIRAQVDAQTLDVAVVGDALTGWKWGDPLVDNQFKLEFINPTLKLFREGVEVGTLNTGLAAVTTNAQNLVMGDTFAGTLRDVDLWNNMGLGSQARVVKYGFNPGSPTLDDISESTSTDPIYTGLVQDEGPNNLDATYSITGSQANITVAVGPVATTFTDPALTVPERFKSVLGSANKSNPFSKSTAAQRMPLYNTFETARTSLGMPSDAWWFMIIGGTSGILAVLIFSSTRLYPLAAGAVVAGLTLGAVLGVLAPWPAIIAGIVSVVIWLLTQWQRE